MIDNFQKNSILIPEQLPEFIRDNPEYSNFVLFIKAYYEWMEQNGQVTERTRNLLNYRDIDKTTSEFIDYYINDFLPYFPKDILVDEDKAVKLARQLYQSKGTPASYAFLFKVLYNSDFDIFYNKEAVLKPSDGVWYIAKSLRLGTTDDNFTKVDNLRLFGESSKSIATIENSIQAKDKTEVFISNIQRLFESGEFVRVVDNQNRDVLFNGQPLRAKILGQLSQILVDPKKRGLLYQVGDPVVVFGGLNSNTGIGAIAEVSETTTGSVKSVSVLEGGQGYVSLTSTPTVPPNTQIVFENLNSGAASPVAVVASVDPDQASNVALVATDSIELKAGIPIGNAYYNFAANLNANVSCTLANALSFITYSTGPITSVIVTNSGGGISTIPDVVARSMYPNDILGGSNLKNLGILGPIKILNGGRGYQNNDTIVFTGGTGYGAYAKVNGVNATGYIQSVGYYTVANSYSLGGMGYRTEYLPALSVSSANANATGALLVVSGILGDGAEFGVVVDRAGSVTRIKMTEFGEDYIATPNVSLRVQDIVVSNVSLSNLPDRNSIVYQGSNVATSAYISRYDSVSLLAPDADSSKSLYRLRVYNYNSSPNTQLNLSVQDKNINFVMANTAWLAPGQVSSNYNRFGVRVYGDGTARANATFLNGLTLGDGQWLNSRGRLSSFSKLQNEDYNNYTYQVTVEKEITKYREVLLELLHPIGMKLIGRYSNRDQKDYDFHPQTALKFGRNLFSYTGTAASAVQVYADWTNKSNNILNFVNMSGANVANVVFANSTISLNSLTGPDFIAEVESIDGANNIVVMKSNVWLTFPNVAYVSANANSNVINIRSVTNSYNIVNNGNYSNTMYPMMDIVFTGDNIRIGNVVKQVQQLDLARNRIFVANNFSTNVSNSLMSVNRVLTAGGQLSRQDEVIIYGPVGTQYIPELITESGDTLTTEDGKILILG
jgi:hypothetical protein